MLLTQVHFQVRKEVHVFARGEGDQGSCVADNKLYERKLEYKQCETNDQLSELDKSLLHHELCLGVTVDFTQ